MPVSLNKEECVSGHFFEQHRLEVHNCFLEQLHAEQSLNDLVPRLVVKPQNLCEARLASRSCRMRVQVVVFDLDEVHDGRTAPVNCASVRLSAKASLSVKRSTLQFMACGRSARKKEPKLTTVAR